VVYLKDCGDDNQRERERERRVLWGRAEALNGVWVGGTWEASNSGGLFKGIGVKLQSSCAELTLGFLSFVSFLKT